MKITKLALNDILYELVSDITIDNTLTTNQDSVPSTALVKTNIDRIDNNVSEVNTQLSTIQSNLSSLQTSVSELNAKSLLFRGNFTGDFDDTNILPGIYDVTASAQHIPEVNGTPFGGGYFTFIQFPTVTKTQQAIGRGIISRSYQGDPANWTEWITSPNV